MPIKTTLFTSTSTRAARARSSWRRVAWTIVQETNYPWDGNIELTLHPEETAEFTLALRIPGWAQGQPVPSDLYHYVNENGEAAALEVNGKAAELTLERGFALIHRRWSAGDKVRLRLPMPVRRVESHEAVESNVGKVAIERGPIVYCAEGADNGGVVRNADLV